MSKQLDKRRLAVSHNLRRYSARAGTGECAWDCTRKRASAHLIWRLRRHRERQAQIRCGDRELPQQAAGRTVDGQADTTVRCVAGDIFFLFLFLFSLPRLIGGGEAVTF